MLKIRRTLEGHSSPTDYYAKSKQAQQLHNLKNWNLASSTKKYPPFLLLN
jgi:hypothetical protein